MNVMTDNIVAGYLLGPSAVVILFVTQRVVALTGGQINGIVNASWAGLTDLRTRGHQEAFVARVLEITRLVVGLGVTITGTVAAYDERFVRLWVGGSKFGGTLLVVLAALTCLLLGITLVYAWLLDAGGDTSYRIPVSITGAILNLVLSIIFVKTIGIPGVLLGTVVACSLTDAWFCPYMVSKRYRVPASAIAATVFGGIARGLPWVAIAWIVSHRNFRGGWITFAIETILMGILSLLYSWLIVITPSERQRWLLRLRIRSKQAA
jgi:O-antigen/teichoic acid export membrane protein